MWHFFNQRYRCLGVTGSGKGVGSSPCYANAGDAVLQVSTSGLFSFQISIHLKDADGRGGYFLMTDTAKKQSLV